MKNKILASLLAVSLFVGLAVPAFAAFPPSSVSGEDEKITALATREASYTIKNGDPAKNLADEVMAYCGTTAIAQNPILEFSISDNTTFGIDSNGNVSNIGEDSGTATVTIAANEGKVKTTVKVVAAKADTSSKIATGFKFSASKFNVVAGQNDQTIKIAPTPTGYKFTATQIAAIDTAMLAATPTGIDSITAVDAGKADADGNLIYEVAAANVSTTDIALSIRIGLPKAHDANVKYVETTRATKIAVVTPVPATAVFRTGSITIEVGEIADLKDKVKVGPSNSNIDKDITWSMDLYNADSETADYAVLDDAAGSTKILGVAVGKMKAIATLSKDTSKTAEVIINVVAKGTTIKNEVKVVPNAKMIVGGTYPIVVSGVPAGITPKFTSLIPTIATVAADGTVKALAEGVVKVKVEVEGNADLYVTINVTKAPVIEDVPEPTEPPSTGVSFFTL